MPRPPIAAAALSLLLAQAPGWACMCHEGQPMGCAAGEADPCASTHAESAQPRRQAPADLQQPPKSVDLSGLIDEPPKVPCSGPGGLCYSPEQLQKISGALNAQYKDVRLNDDGMFKRALAWFLGRSDNRPAANLGEVATRVFDPKKGVGAATDIDPVKVGAISKYFATEKDEIARIDKLQPGQDRRQTIQQAAEELAKTAMAPLENLDREVHDALMKSGDPLTAMAMAPEKWRDLEPGNSNAWGQTAQQNLANGNYPAAIKDAGRALALDPKNEEALSAKSSAEFKQGDFPAAAQDAKAALQLDPKDKNALSVYQLSAGRDASSGAGEQSQIAAAPAGDSTPGAAAATGGARPAPDLALTSLALGQSAQFSKQAQTALGLRDYKAAIAHSTRALELNPNNTEALAARSAAYNALGDHAAALKDAVAALQLAPKSAYMLNAKAYALNKTKQYQAALDAASAALALDPKDARALANKAYALGGLGDKAGMLAALKTAASLDPRFQTSLQSAIEAPSDADVVFLFPGEEAAGAPAAAPAPVSRAKRFGSLSLFTVIGGLLLGLGLLPIALPPLARTIRRFVTERRTRHPAVTVVQRGPEREDVGPPK